MADKVGKCTCHCVSAPCTFPESVARSAQTAFSAFLRIQRRFLEIIAPYASRVTICCNTSPQIVYVVIENTENSKEGRFGPCRHALLSILRRGCGVKTLQFGVN